MANLWRRRARVGGWVAVGSAALGLATQLIGTPFLIIAVVQSFTPWAIPLLLIVALFTSRHGDDRLGFSAAAVTLAHLAFISPLVFPASGPEPAPDATPFRVMAINVLYSNDRIDRVAESILETDPDLVALNEVTPDLIVSLQRHDAAARYPYRRDRPTDLAGGVALWSKYPIVDAPPLTGLRRSIHVVAELPQGDTGFVVVHPPPPVFNRTVWSRELDALPSIASRTTMPLVVLGDFNASWFHPPFRRAVGDAEMTDALVAVGRGLAMTWPTDLFVPPFVTLDHILVSREIAAIDGLVLRIPGSDHRAVVADLAAAGR